MLLVIVPVFANMFFPNPVTKWFAAKFDIKVLSAIGILIASGLDLADTRQVIKNRIPWGTIIMVCGMSTLIVPMIILLSFVTTGPAFIFPLFIPMFPAISAAAGMSPYSRGGAMVVIGCRDENLREGIWKEQLKYAFIYLGFNVFVSLTGIYQLIAGIF